MPTNYRVNASNNADVAAKKAYNAALTEARQALATAAAIRTQIASGNSAFAGPSQGHLATALEAACKARVFATE